MSIAAGSVPVVTLDGPSASGKSTLSRSIAEYFGWMWVSTGAFYRGLALASQKLKIDSSDEEALAKLCSQVSVWRVQLTLERTRVFFQDHDVTDLISQEDVALLSSSISHFPKVRQALLQVQRNCINGTQGLVAEGRDCGTVVFPEAIAKIYLTANLENRVQRRAKELGLEAASLNALQKQRDTQDTNRKTAPMKVAEGSLVLDTTHLDLAEAAEQAIGFIKTKWNP